MCLETKCIYLQHLNVSTKHGGAPWELEMAVGSSGVAQ